MKSPLHVWKIAVLLYKLFPRTSEHTRLMANSTQKILLIWQGHSLKHTDPFDFLTPINHIGSSLTILFACYFIIFLYPSQKCCNELTQRREKMNCFKILKRLKDKKSGVALIQLSLTLHYSRRIFYYQHYIQFNLYFLCFVTDELNAFKIINNNYARR